MIRCACVWAVLFAASGCVARLDVTKTATLDLGGNFEVKYDLPSQPKEQTVLVELTSTVTEVDVFVVLASKWDEFEKASNDGRAKAAADSKLKTKAASLSAVVPAKAECRVVVQLAGAKKTDITVKMTNKK